MTQNDIQTRQGLPEDMQVLLRDYPRDIWPDHPNFAASIRNWMGAHQMFRQLSELVTKDTELRMDGKTDPDLYTKRLARFGDMLVRNLHGHHGWEDHAFFPEIAGADARFVRGLDMLEGDHLELDRVLDRLTRRANRFIQLSQLAPEQAAVELGPLHEAAAGIGGFLHRHLDDEEDLIVPILLHHKMRG